METGLSDDQIYDIFNTFNKSTAKEILVSVILLKAFMEEINTHSYQTQACAFDFHGLITKKIQSNSESYTVDRAVLWRLLQHYNKMHRKTSQFPIKKEVVDEKPKQAATVQEPAARVLESTGPAEPEVKEEVSIFDQFA
jgi:hypothetical protein